jgi:hypothetical protein
MELINLKIEANPLKSGIASDISNQNDELNIDLILDILGNLTRRRILLLLAKEPLYFNQLNYRNRTTIYSSPYENFRRIWINRNIYTRK